MSQDQRAANHEIADAAVLVIVDVGSANSDRQDPNEDLAFRWSWNRTLFNPQIAWGVQDRGGHRAGGLHWTRPSLRKSEGLAARQPCGGRRGDSLQPVAD